MWGVKKRTCEWNSMICLLVWNHVSTTPLFIGQRKPQRPQRSVGRPERGAPRALTYPNPPTLTPMEQHQHARRPTNGRRSQAGENEASAVQRKDATIGLDSTTR